MNLMTLGMAASVCLAVAMAHGQTPETPPKAPTPPVDRVAGMAIEDMRSALQMRFDRMDANGDGFISKDEFPERRGFTGGNGRPSTDEGGRSTDRPRASGRAPQRQARLPMQWRSFDQFDSDKDGQVSKDELTAPIEELAALDTNGDGRLDRSEMQSARQPRDATKKASKNTQ